MRQLVTLEEAWDIIQRLRDKYHFKRETAEKPVNPSIVGLELAEKVIAPEDSPSHDIASYDGFALRRGDSHRYPCASWAVFTKCR